MQYYTSIRAYINESKHGGSWLPATYNGADGHLSGVPNSTTMVRLVYLKPVEYKTHEQYFRIGDYILKNIPTGWTISVDNATGIVNSGTVDGVQYGALGGGRYRFGITETPTRIDVRALSPSSGGPHSLVEGDYDIVFEPYEALFDAGEFFAPDYLSDVDFVAEIRDMGWRQCNEMGFTSGFTPTEIVITDFKQEGDASWTPGAGIGCPPEIPARLAKKIGSDLAMNLPPKCTVSCRQSVVTLSEGVGFTGIYYLGGPNEVWNTAFGDARTYLADKVFAGLDYDGLGVDLIAYNDDGTVNSAPSTNAKISAAYAHWLLQMWKAAEDAGVPRARIKRVVEGQMAQFANSGLTKGILQYIDPGILATGSRVYDLVDEVRGAPYFFMKGPTDDIAYTISIKNLIENKAYTLPASVIVQSCIDYIDASLIPAFAAYRSGLDALRPSPQIALGTYEDGKHIQSHATPATSGGSYNFNIDAVANTFTSVSAVDITAAFEDGDSIRVWDPGSPATGVAHKTILYVVVVGTTDLEVYTDAALTARVTLDANPASTYRLDAWSRLVSLNEWLREFYNGDGGATVYEYLWDAHVSADVTCFNQFHDVSNWGYGHTSGWGMKQKQGGTTTDNPIFTWWRALAPADVPSGLEGEGGPVSNPLLALVGR